jgi:glucose-1-phosphate thymidylyltransferase
MQEKPQHPKSQYAVPPFYIYKKSDIQHIKTCLSDNGIMDAPGNLVKSLLDKTVIHAWEMNGKRYDIGTLETYYQFKDNWK